MAGNSGKKSSQAAKRTSGTSRTTRTSKSPAASRRSGTTSARARSTRKSTRGYDGGDSFIPREIAVIFLFAVMVFLFLSNFGIMGSVGRFFSRLQFGLFGLQAYVVPVLVFVLALFLYANRDAEGVGSKITAIVLLLLVIGIICELVDAEMIDGMKYSAKEIYLRCAGDKSGGGLIAGSIAFALYSMLKLAGTILVLLVVAVSSLVLLSRRSLLDALSSGARKVGEGARIAHENVRERKRIRREQYEEDYPDAPEEYPPYDDGQDVYSDDYYSPEDAVFEETARERLLRGRRGKISGVEIHTFLEREPAEAAVDIPADALTGMEEAAPAPEEEIPQFRGGDMHEIVMPEDGADVSSGAVFKPADPLPKDADRSGMVIEPTVFREPYGDEDEAAAPEMPVTEQPEDAQIWQETEISGAPAAAEDLTGPETQLMKQMPQSGDRFSSEQMSNIQVHSERVRESTAAGRPQDAQQQVQEPLAEASAPAAIPHAAHKAPARPHKYVFPKLDLLKKGDRGRNAASELELKETALRLEETLRTFGVNVTITDISQGPAVTRYELLPDQGVKVSRIVSLQDDIKMHLAATDIRIEAPIPGKSAIGIEVPNRENSIVTLRDILESQDYRTFKSGLAFPVGKDIAGQPIVFDIARMPHVLIAGSTGSGKSVCINTIIMGILYKASPEDVRLIMVDPKIVELSVYNGIPHLLIPVVTEPKKAAAALNWAVAEMNDRYRKFAEAKVRDLKGYNEIARQKREEDPETEMKPMPQIVIIVDELADLMMVSANEVEEAICRLAQLARAAGIHLIIATQRPSVDVITGLIKANMPSRIAFAVSSGVDSRTILDMVGAEKLLGKGDMLFYPQGYAKPTRVQGAFVSDGEVSDVVAYIKEKNPVVDGENEVQNRIDSFASGPDAPGAIPSPGGDSGMDELFAEAGRFIIEKEKASIGLLQRRFKIGFNRAARIMDQLCDAGVVSDEEGTKARHILMNAMEFENYLSENGL